LKLIFFLEAEWERKQRNREYRVAARREKRLRKADEKKQRKLNATILRRMVRLSTEARFEAIANRRLPFRPRIPISTTKMSIEIEDVTSS
jgi:hypothetical protein